MAQALYLSIDQRPTPQELDRYLLSHTVAQASQRWNCNERTIRKWRARADDAPTPSERPQDEPNTPAPIVSTPTFTPTSDDVAGCGTMWRDPWSKELIPVIPGTHRRAWEAERSAAMERHAASIVPSVMSTAPDVWQDVVMPTAPAPIADMAVQSDELSGPTRPSMTEVPIAAPDPAPLVDVSSKGIDSKVSTVAQPPMMRSPMVPDAPMLTWAYDHAPLVQLLAALVVVVLVALMGA